jgi:hypothetical protein
MVAKAAISRARKAGLGLQDAALFYFVDADMAAAFVDRFACGLIIGREPPASVTPWWK